MTTTTTMSAHSLLDTLSAYYNNTTTNNQQQYILLSSAIGAIGVLGGLALYRNGVLKAKLGLPETVDATVNNADILESETFIANKTEYLIVNGKRLRVVFRQHKLGSRVPLLFFIHGMGGQAPQWNEQLTHFAKTCSVLAVDIIGHGQSSGSSNWSDYKTEAIVQDLLFVLHEYVDRIVTGRRPSSSSSSSSSSSKAASPTLLDSNSNSNANSTSNLNDQAQPQTPPDVVLICHSYGTALGPMLYHHQPDLIRAIVLISPKTSIQASKVRKIKRIAYFPNFFINIMRYLDRRGGIHSASVNRYLDASASTLLREKQFAINASVRTDTVKKLTYGMSWPSQEVLQSINVPALLIGGQNDHVTPVEEMVILHQWLLGYHGIIPTPTDDSTPSTPTSRSATPTHSLKKSHYPSPYIVPNAGHSVMMEQPELVNAIISKFLIERAHLETMSLQWQILEEQRKKDESKWSLKNLNKWLATDSIAKYPVKYSLFRPMKVMRQTDSVHSPMVLKNSYTEIGLVIDISKDSPSYDILEFTPYPGEESPDTKLDTTTTYYKKIATTSKIPPTKDEVTRFIQVVKGYWRRCPGKQIAVHCHYGFNRTGFMICCYLAEVENVPVQEAIKAFAEARPNGIRHVHFINELVLRYAPRTRIRDSVSKVSPKKK